MEEHRAAVSPVSPDWIRSVAPQDALPAGLAAVTQYEPASLGLSSFIRRLCRSPSALTARKASLWISTLFFLHVTEGAEERGRVGGGKKNKKHTTKHIYMDDNKASHAKKIQISQR